MWKYCWGETLFIVNHSLLFDQNYCLRKSAVMLGLIFFDNFIFSFGKNREKLFVIIIGQLQLPFTHYYYIQKSDVIFVVFFLIYLFNFNFKEEGKIVEVLFRRGTVHCKYSSLFNRNYYFIEKRCIFYFHFFGVFIFLILKSVVIFVLQLGETYFRKF